MLYIPFGIGYFVLRSLLWDARRPGIGPELAYVVNVNSPFQGCTGYQTGLHSHETGLVTHASERFYFLWPLR